MQEVAEIKQRLAKQNPASFLLIFVFSTFTCGIGNDRSAKCPSVA